MLNRLYSVWLCSTLLCSCSLDSTPRLTTGNSRQSADRESDGWKPAGSSNSGVGARAADGGSAVDAATSDKANQAKADAMAPAHMGAPMGNGGSGSSNQKPQKDPAAPSSAPPPNTITDAGAASSHMQSDPPAAGGGQADPPAAGSGGTSGDSTSAAGAGGAAGDEADIRQRFIDAAIAALGGDAAGDPDAGTERWRRSGGSPGGLSPEFVLPVLLSMRNSAICFRDVRRCVELCVVLASDCKPCASDAECGQALKDVCGTTIGSCGEP